MKVEGNKDNCQGCYFLKEKGRLVDSQDIPYCARVRVEIHNIKVCLTGPMVLLEKYARKTI